MAEVGDLIHWPTGYDSYEVDVFKVGYGYELERLVDGMTEIEWVERELNDKYAPLEEQLTELVVRGEWTAEGRDEHLAQLAAIINATASNLFGNVTEELDEYARTWFGKPPKDESNGVWHS